MKSRSRRRLGSRRGSARITLTRPDGLALLGAAYLMTEDAYVALGGRSARRTVTLWPKKGRSPAPLAAGFRLEYANQLRRWALARRGRALRAQVLRRALALSDGVGPRAARPAPPLSPERRAEIERLLAEAEALPGDPLGIARTWEESRKARS